MSVVFAAGFLVPQQLADLEYFQEAAVVHFQARYSRLYHLSLT